MSQFLVKQSREDARYAYAVGVVRAREKRLFKKNDFENMLKAAGEEKTFNLLKENPDYARIFGEEPLSHFEKGLQEELRSIYKLIEQISPENKWVNLFKLKYDFHNLKVFLKGEEGEGLSLDLGLIPLAKLKSILKNRAYRELGPFLSKIYQNAFSLKEEGRDLRQIEIFLDKSLLKATFNLSQNNYPFLEGFFRLKIDKYNLMTFLRIKREKEERDLLPVSLLEDGFLRKDLLLKLFKDPLETLLERVMPMPYGSFIQEGLLHYQQENSLVYLEKLWEDYLLNYVLIGKYTTFGLEALAGYLLAKEYEIKNIRIILLGKINKLSRADIQRHLRITYV